MAERLVSSDNGGSEEREGHNSAKLGSTSVTNSQTRVSSNDSCSFTSKLKQLPVATVREKLSFPLKFERTAFCLDFASAGGSATSDCEPTSLRQFKLRTIGSPKKTSLGRSKVTVPPKKKFNSAEKVKSSPFSQAAYSQDEGGLSSLLSSGASEFTHQSPYKKGGDHRSKKYRVK